MRWSKRGLLVPAGAAGHGYSLHAQVPVLDRAASPLALYFSSRDDQGRSHPFVIELEKTETGFKRGNRVRPVELALGEEGEFDEHGIMPTAVMRSAGEIRLYYIGWSRRGNYPYTNHIGLAISRDGLNWHKRGRVMFDTGCLYTGTLEIVAAEKGYLGYYLACDQWLPADDDIPAEAMYRLRIASSKDGLDWQPLGKIAIDYHDHGEGGIGSAQVLSCADRHHMFYCARGQRSFRTDPATSYRIGYASSDDLINWQRRDDVMASFREQEDWASLMQCFPALLPDDETGTLWMFYNGNGFGQTGIGLAALPIEELPRA